METAPFFSVCIPQYNRTSHLIASIEALAGQTWEDFEVCISDDCSPDGRQSEVEAALKDAGLNFTFHRQQRNLRYDANLRAAIGLARGRYCLLMGNDDRLLNSDALASVHTLLVQYALPEVVITNYEASGKQVRRSRRTEIHAGTPLLAATRFRDFSFVSGIVFERQAAELYATEAWDGSEMYQMYVGCRILAAGGRLLDVEESMVFKDLQIPDEVVDSYALRPKVEEWTLTERKLPLMQIPALVLDSLQRQGGLGIDYFARRVLAQLLLFTYPFWLIEYRRVQSWPYAVGVARGMRPRNLVSRCPQLRWHTRMFTVAIYSTATAIALVTPTRLFDRLRSRLYSLARSTFR